MYLKYPLKRDTVIHAFREVGRKMGLSLYQCAAVVLLCAQCRLCADEKAAAEQRKRPAGSERVVLQLLWRHQFQFAGYYMAQEKGYYREAGFDVVFKEKTAGLSTVDEVLSGRADFGVCNTSLLADYLRGEPVVVLAAVLQHSPIVVAATKRSGVRSVKDLVGKRVMMPDDTPSLELSAMLASRSISADQFETVPHEQTVAALIEGRADACVGYITDEPYELQKANAPYVIFDPRDYGADYYGDFLFTSQMRSRTRPERVQAFRAASMRGWAYAIEHVDETVGLIVRSYAPGADRDKLLYEARTFRRLMVSDMIEIGRVNPERWKRMMKSAAVNAEMPPEAIDDEIGDDLLFDESDAYPLRRWVRQLIAGLAGTGFVILCLTMLILALGRVVRRRTADLSETNRKLASENAEYRKMQQLFQLQRDMAVAIWEESSLQSVFERLRDLILRIPDVDCCGIYLMRDRERVLDMVAHRGISAAYAEAFATYDENSPYGKYVLNGRSVWLGQETVQRECGTATAMEGLRAVIVVPVMFEKSVIASLHVSSHTAAEFPATVMNAVEALATMIGSAITRKKADELLRQSEERFRLIVEHAGVSMMVTDASGRVLFSNVEARGTESDAGQGQEQRATEEVMTKEFGKRYSAQILQVIEKGEEMEFVSRVVVDSAPQFFEITMRPFSVEMPASRRVLIMTKDVTDKWKTMEALKESESLFRCVAEGAFDAISLSDVEGRYVYANTRLTQMTGFAREELLGSPFTRLLGPGEIQRARKRFKDRLAGHAVPSSYATTLCRKDGSMLPVEVTVREIEWRGKRAFACVYRDISERKRLELEVLKIGEWEKVRIGQDLHDSIGQQLVGMSYLLEALEHALKVSRSAHVKDAAELKDICRTVHQQLRGVVLGLLPLGIDECLANGLKRLCENVRNRIGVACSLNDTLGPRHIDVMHESFLFQIAQEAVANAVRHGHAREIIISLERAGDSGVLRIDDDGCGFDVDNVRSGGSGLKIMRYRADVLDGTLSVRKRDTAGMSVACVFGFSQDLNPQSIKEGQHEITHA